MLDETSFLARLLGWIDLFWIWWIVNLAIGVGRAVQAEERVRLPGRCSAVYLVFALVIAAALTAFAGA